LPPCEYCPSPPDTPSTVRYLQLYVVTAER